MLVFKIVPNKIVQSTLLCNNSVDKAHTYFDEITYGAITPYIGKKMPIEIAAKLPSRLGNWMAVKEEGPEVSCYAIYFGTFKIFGCQTDRIRR